MSHFYRYFPRVNKSSYLTVNTVVIYLDSAADSTNTLIITSSHAWTVTSSSEYGWDYVSLSETTGTIPPYSHSVTVTATQENTGDDQRTVAYLTITNTRGDTVYVQVVQNPASEEVNAVLYSNRYNGNLVSDDENTTYVTNTFIEDDAGSRYLSARPFRYKKEISVTDVPGAGININEMIHPGYATDLEGDEDYCVFALFSCPVNYGSNVSAIPIGRMSKPRGTSNYYIEQGSGSNTNTFYFPASKDTEFPLFGYFINKYQQPASKTTKISPAVTITAGGMGMFSIPANANGTGGTSRTVSCTSDSSYVTVTQEEEEQTLWGWSCTKFIVKVNAASSLSINHTTKLTFYYEEDGTKIVSYVIKIVHVVDESKLIPVYTATYDPSADEPEDTIDTDFAKMGFGGFLGNGVTYIYSEGDLGTFNVNQHHSTESTYVSGTWFKADSYVTFYRLNEGSGGLAATFLGSVKASGDTYTGKFTIPDDVVTAYLQSENLGLRMKIERLVDGQYVDGAIDTSCSQIACTHTFDNGVRNDKLLYSFTTYRVDSNGNLTGWGSYSDTFYLAADRGLVYNGEKITKSGYYGDESGTESAYVYITVPTSTTRWRVKFLTPPINGVVSYETYYTGDTD